MYEVLATVDGKGHAAFAARGDGTWEVQPRPYAEQVARLAETGRPAMIAPSIPMIPADIADAFWAYLTFLEVCRNAYPGCDFAVRGDYPWVSRVPNASLYGGGRWGLQQG